MNSKKYKQICDQPDVLSKSILEKTVCILKNKGKHEFCLLKKILETKAIPFPEKHSGAEDSLYYKVNILEIEAEAITDILFDLEASSVPLDGIGTSETYMYVSLVNIWSELTEYVRKTL